MLIRVKVFAILKEMLGAGEILLDFAEGASCKEVLSQLEKQDGEIASVLDHSLIAVNGQYADLETCLQAEDEVAILPPVSGG